MRVTISLRSDGPPPAPDDAVLLSRVLAGLASRASAEVVTHLVVDANLGSAIDAIRGACGDWIQARDTRAWGELSVHSHEAALGSSCVRRLRFLRCIAELEPDAVIDVRLAGGDTEASDPLPFMAFSHTLPLVSPGATAIVHARSADTLTALLRVFAQDAVGRIDTPASDANNPHRHRSTARWLIVSSGRGESAADVARLVRSHPEVREVTVQRADSIGVGEMAGCGIVYVPEPGVGLEAMMGLLVRNRGHVVVQEDEINALLPQLTLDTVLQVAYSVLGYTEMRRVLEGGSIDTPIFSSWLRQQARGVSYRACPDSWMHWQAAIDADLNRSLSDQDLRDAELQDVFSSDIGKPSDRMRRLLVDISALVKFDAKSGIQRVVRNVLTHLEKVLPQHLQPVPIAFMDDGRCFHASTFYARFSGFPYDVPSDQPLKVRPGDMFLGLDLSAHIVPFHLDRFHRFRRAGIPLHFVLYDMLPMSRPECFDPRVVDVFKAWYESVADIADGVLCISRAVADEFADWMDERRPVRLAPMRIGYFHLGADIVISGKEQPSAPELAAVAALEGRRFVLMVSTLEPRKGYEQAVAAFESLWLEDSDLGLVIVGREGWLMKGLADRLHTHSERGARLHWFEGISDGLLAHLYRNADLLLSASEGEGFGLPLIEAAQQGVPVLCRDIPVFREIAGEAATYFGGYRPEALADAVRAWARKGHEPSAPMIAWKTWLEATTELIDTLLSPTSYATWEPGQRRRVFSGYNPRLGVISGERSRGEIVTTGQAGFLMHGPYEPFDAGAYRLLIRGALPEGHAKGIRVELVSNGAERQVAENIPMLQRQDNVLVDYGFILESDVQDLEVRVMVADESAVHISKVEFLAVGCRDEFPDYSYMKKQQELCE